MARKNAPKKGTGPPQQLISRIEHLQDLLQNLPPTLPILEAKESTYHFGLDYDNLDDRGPLGSFSHCMEVCFRPSRGQPLQIVERGPRLHRDLIKTMKEAVHLMSDGDRAVFAQAWLERIIEAAVHAGGVGSKTKEGKRRRQAALGEDTEAQEPDEEARLKRRKDLAIEQEPISISDGEVDESTMEIDVRTSRASTSDGMDIDDVLAMDTASDRSLSTPPTRPPTAPSFATAGPSSLPSLHTKSKPKQTKLNFRRVRDMSSEEKAAFEEQQRGEAEESRSRVQAWEEEKRRKEEERREKKKIANRERKRKSRAVAAARKAAEGATASSDVEDATPHLMRGAEVASPAVVIADKAEVSRPTTQDWRETRNGVLGGTQHNKAVRVNWYHPFLWTFIDLTMRRVGWSADACEKALKRAHPELYAGVNPDGTVALNRGLDKGTIQKWKAGRGSFEWSQATNENVQRAKVAAAKGRAGVLGKHPDLVQKIKQLFTDLRKAGMVINVAIARPLMIAHIKAHDPSILEGEDGFRCSEHFVRDFLQSVMGWSLRKATRAAAHIPPDADVVCTRSAFRIVYLIRWHHVPLKLLINMDELGNYLVPSSSHTYAEVGVKQVDAVGKDEKRAYTVCVASTASGDFLPFQQVCGGQSKRSIPSPDADGMDKAREYGFHFTWAGSETSPRSHYSTQKTMKEWLDHILVPYINSVIDNDPSLGPNQKAILLIDAYPVHISEAFRQVLSGYPNICTCFVPNNCTGIMQPADVGLQRPLKHVMKQAIFDFLTAEHLRQLKDGIEPEHIVMTSSAPVLRNASVNALNRAYEFATSPAGRDLIRKAWSRSGPPGRPEITLSPDWLTSSDAHEALDKYLDQDDTLYNEIKSRMGHVLGKFDSRDEHERGMNPEAIDDSDVPLEAVIRATFGEEVTMDDITIWYGDPLTHMVMIGRTML